MSSTDAVSGCLQEAEDVPLVLAMLHRQRLSRAHKVHVQVLALERCLVGRILQL